MINELSEVTRINRLLSFYGNLLTKQQQEIMQSYFVYNLSLKEIAEDKSISRTAVSDAIKVSTKKLEEYENALKICKVFDEEKQSNPKAKEEIERLEDKLTNGI